MGVAGQDMLLVARLVLEQCSGGCEVEVTDATLCTGDAPEVKPARSALGADALRPPPFPPRGASGFVHPNAARCVEEVEGEPFVGN